MGKDKQEKKEKKGKKSKQKEEEVAAAPAAEPNVEKKEKKKKSKKSEEPVATPAPAAVPEPESEPTEAPTKKQKTEDGAAPTSFASEDERKIFIGGCPDSIDDDAVKALCEGVESCRWVMKDGAFRGFGFITFETPEQAQAVANKGEIEILGRTCRVNMAGQKTERPQGGAGGFGGNRNAGGAGGAGGGKFADDSRRVFIGRCPDSIDDSAVSGVEGFESVRWISDRNTGKFKGCGFITFADDASAQKFASQGTFDVSGQSCQVRLASEPMGGGNAGGGGGAAGGFGGGRPARDDSKTVFIGGVSEDVNDDDVKSAFQGVSSIRWVKDRDTGAFKGVGFIEFESESAAQSVANQGSVDLKGSNCRVSMAGDKPAGGRGGGRGGRGGRGRGRGPPKTSLEHQGHGSKMTFDD